MDKIKPYRQLIILSGILIIAYFAYTFLDKLEILRSPYGVKANTVRIQLGIPIIEENMKPRNNYNKSGNLWILANEFPDYGMILHNFKIVRTDEKTLKTKREEDAFIRKINDSIFQQFIVGFEFVNDKVIRKNGVLRLRHNTDFFGFDNQEKFLDDRATDSIAKKWHLKISNINN